MPARFVLVAVHTICQLLAVCVKTNQPALTFEIRAWCEQKQENCVLERYGGVATTGS